MSEIFSHKKYEEKLKEIFVRFPSVQSSGFGGSSYKPGLDHMIEFDRILGHPHESYSTVHVAGTNGKGSVANMLASTLSAAGLKTGLYTSPHILDFRERMRIYDPGKEELYLVSEEYVLDFIETYEPTFNDLDLSFFEITTAMAFKWFADQGVDAAVIEVGLGGRLDSTNIITPELSVITSIGLDHCSLLGDTREAIAEEKSGIMKPGVVTVVGETDDTLTPVFESCAWMKCPVVYAQKKDPSLWYKNEILLRNMDLQGGYQKTNLRTALCAVDQLKQMGKFKGLNDAAKVENAILKTASRMQFHGRWEQLSIHPWTICDIGHNPPALTKNFAQLEDMLSSGECTSLIIVYGIMADKDLDSIMPLMPKDATYVFTSPESARSLSWDKLRDRYLEFCQKSGRSKSRVYASQSVRDAVSTAVKIASQYPGKPLIYIGGSTFVVSEAVACFK